ncbi:MULTISPECIES: endopeptidase La [Peptoniphilus]|uniref:Lon protease n=1 Tax=Peptoniphilus duerdenii ATCC BAA-1640 TaxID=862517 RepID=E0NP53_9FIRM|nr:MULTISPECIES: endopeptidase La [Peptoniphilus]EFM24521.1 endopeptidase La [Peptoniphilus duerdenii ATCC BAA-1640]ERT63501.1 endopeptidase La [Peptoniphilus sp. BV3AC2]MDK8275501.1 endopeptidase La [Peptoniphilus duerdenii]
MNIEKMPMIPLRGIVVFPGMVTHFDCGRDRTIGAIEESEIRNSKVFLVSQKDEEVEDPTMDEIYTVGAIASIKQILKIPGGIVRILIEGEKRGRIISSEEKEKYTEVEVEVFESKDIEMNSNVEALVRLCEKDIQEYSEMDQKMLPGMLDSLINKDTPETMMDTACCYIDLSVENAQEILEVEDLEERLEIFHEIFSKEVELLKIEREIDTRVKSQLDKMQKEYYLKEQLEVIKKELGEEKESDEYTKKLEEKNLPEEIRARAQKEIEKLSTISVQSPEYAVIMNYLDWIMDLPWNDSAEENIDIKNARKILDKEHYGLKKVKERILEFIAVRKLNKGAKGPILCLVGPPGVGKTSIASSIAHALDKNFVRMSLGGVTDEAEIRGHRRTYIGAMPGRVISLMKEAKQKNPVFLMDEIDKVGNNYRGDPASGLLEVLDPVQNKTFTDHYMELPFDLSEVFFVTTANTTSTIPGPLLDRMEIINLEGYTPNEKFNIAKRYLVPRQLKESGLSEENVTISDGAIEDIIAYYTREAGVRTLEQNISKIIRKAAMNIVEGEKEKISITKKNLNKFLGEKIFLFDLVNKENQVGVVNGLAWTAVGGTTLTIEATVMKGKGNLTLTGSLGNVMKESATAAVSYIAANAEKFNIKEDFRQKNDIHIHVPEGAVPKDGPSAGVTITTALVSALTKRPVRRDVAMTGEITLRGRVLPIGGLKEKLLAAQRMGVKTVIIPKENIRDLNEIEDNVKNLLEIIPVSDAEKVIEIALEQK